MPFLNDGTPVDIVLNPSVFRTYEHRSDLETHLGWAAAPAGTSIVATTGWATLPEECSRAPGRKHRHPGVRRAREGEPDRCWSHHANRGRLQLVELQRQGHLVRRSSGEPFPWEIALATCTS